MISSKRRVILYKNAIELEEGKDVLIDIRWDTKSLYKFVEQQLGVSCKKLYNSHGNNIELPDRIREGDVLFASQGENFLAKKAKLPPSNKFRITMLGKGGVGKSCITQRYLRNVFVKFYDPTIEDWHKKNTMIDGQSATIEILDTGGQEDYLTLRPV